jgi:ABC-2 type transport system ATP-binding protein
MSAISLSDVERRRGDFYALRGVSVEIGSPSIVGLLGRNGAGKTTLLRILAGQEFASAGRVSVFGARPLENDAVLRRMVLVREDQIYPDLRDWDAAQASDLLDAYELPGARKVKQLSRGMRGAVGIIIGLAAHAELTLFDEPVAGLDAVVRDMFYEQLLADYTAHPRCIVLSTHLIDEAADLLDRILILDHGRLVLDALADDLRGNAVTVTGSTAGVERFVARRPTLTRRSLGAQTSIVMVGRLDDRDRELADQLHLDVGRLTLQQLAMHAANGTARAALTTAGAE